jgi:hypothetical protein
MWPVENLFGFITNTLSIFGITNSLSIYSILTKKEFFLYKDVRKVIQFWPWQRKVILIDRAALEKM